MLWIVLTLALAATGALADRFPATDNTRWRTNGTITTTSVTGCDVEYTQSLILQEGAEAFFTFTDAMRYTVQGRKRPDGGDVWIALDGGSQYIYESKQDLAGCINYGAINVAEATNTHQIRIFVPVQDGSVVFELLGVDLAMMEDETIITDNSPSPTRPGQSQPSTTTPTQTITTPSTTSSRSSTPLPSNPSPPEPEPTGLSTGAIVGIGVTIPVILSLVGVFAFIFWRRRRDAQRASRATEGRPTPYGLEAGGRPSVGGRSPATTNTADTKLRGAFLGARGNEKDPQAYHVGDASGSADPFSSSTASSGAKRAVYTRRGDAPNQLPPGAAAPSTPSMSMSGPVTSSGSPTTGSPQLSAEGAPPEMRELYQAMHQAGFTVNTLFDRLRRDGSTRRRGEAAAEVSTVVPQSAVGEPLPRYE